MTFLATYRALGQRSGQQRRVVLAHIPENGERCWATFTQAIVNGKPREVYDGRYFSELPPAFASYVDRCSIHDKALRHQQVLLDVIEIE